jgi:hypothetical protein
MSKHTPGKWTTGNNRIWDGLHEVAHVKTNIEANTRLIAKAPEMLEALHRMVARFGGSCECSMDREATSQARAILAELEGGAP